MKLSKPVTPHTLNRREVRLEWVLVAIVVLSFALIGAGIYYQNRGISHDNVLVPLLFLLYSIFFFLIGYNGITGGAILPKWFGSFFPDKQKLKPGNKLVINVGKVTVGLAILLFILCALSALIQQ